MSLSELYAMILGNESLMQKLALTRLQEQMKTRSPITVEQLLLHIHPICRRAIFLFLRVKMPLEGKRHLDITAVQNAGKHSETLAAVY